MTPLIKLVSVSSHKSLNKHLDTDNRNVLENTLREAALMTDLTSVNLITLDSNLSYLELTGSGSQL